MHLLRWLQQQPDQTFSRSSSLASAPRGLYEGSQLQAFAVRGLPADSRPLKGIFAVPAPLQCLARAWDPERYVPVEGLRPGQSASEGVVEVVNDSFRSPSSFYYPDVRSKGFKLGRGSFGSVERFCEQGTGKVVAVKKMPQQLQQYSLIRREALALQRACECKVPRVVQFVGTGYAQGMECLLMELVQGSALTKLIPRRAQNTPVMEAKMLRIASQLADTLRQLHFVSRMCHLDLSPANIMVCGHKSNAWDAVRLIDFAFAERFDTGDLLGEVDVSIKDIKPRGLTPPYTSPEVLQSLHLQDECAPDGHDELLINGCAADMWSFGCIMFELLTGTKPFGAPPAEFSWSAPPCVPSKNSFRWLVCESVLEKQIEWRSAVQAAQQNGVQIPDHPLIDRVRQCSARPDVAAHFFTKLFSPWPSQRLTNETLHHPYILDTGRQLEAAALKEAGRPITEGRIGAVCALIDASDTDSQSSDNDSMSSNDSSDLSRLYGSAASHPDERTDHASGPQSVMSTRDEAPDYPTQVFGWCSSMVKAVCQMGQSLWMSATCLLPQ